MTANRNLFLRHDTMLGVCQGLGEEFGFSPTWLRLALAFGVLWNPPAIVAIYLALGVVLAGARWLVPAPVASAAPHLAAGQAIAVTSQAAAPERLAA